MAKSTPGTGAETATMRGTGSAEVLELDEERADTKRRDL